METERVGLVQTAGLDPYFREWTKDVRKLCTHPTGKNQKECIECRKINRRIAVTMFSLHGLTLKITHL